jgi:hypothetical protein
MMKKDVIIEGDKVIKYYSNDVSLEYEKAMQLYDLSRAHGFSYPQPISQSHEGRIEFKKISNISSIRDEYIKFMKRKADKDFVKQLFLKAGEVLAIIHNNLKLDCNDHWHPSDIFAHAMNESGVDNENLLAGELPCAHLHCDYGFSNINYIKGGNNRLQLVVLDSSPNNFATFRTGAIGPIYIDIGNMISCIEGLVPVSNYLSMKWELLPEVRGYFLDGYKTYSKTAISIEWVNRFTYATAKCYLTKKYPGKIRKKLALGLLFNKYKDNIHTYQF